MNKFMSIIGACGVVALLGLAACSADDVANDALKDAGVNGDISTGGDLPNDFPADVVTPDLPLETGLGLQGTFTLRYTTNDAAADVAAYRSALAEDGFTITGDFDNLADSATGGNVGFTATSADWNVTVSAFGPDALGGGNYLAVIVAPA